MTVLDQSKLKASAGNKINVSQSANLREPETGSPLLLFITLPDNNKIYSILQVNGLADDKLFATQNIKFVFRLENIVKKGENAGYHHFLHF